MRIHSKRYSKVKANKKGDLADSHTPVGIPSTFEPRPNPLTTGPPIYHGSDGRVPSIPAISNQCYLQFQVKY